MGYVIFFFPSNFPSNGDRRRRAQEHLVNPEDPYYKFCCMNIMKVAPVVNMVGFLLTILITIFSITFVVKSTERYDQNAILIIVLFLAYPLLTSVPFLRLFIAAQKKNYGVPEYWSLIQMVVFADCCIAGFLLTTFYGEECKYNEYRDALHCSNINMDLPLKLTTEFQIFCTIIGVLYILLAIFRFYSLHLQLKIRKYYTHVITGQYAAPLASDAPPVYQPVIESKLHDQFPTTVQTNSSKIARNGGFGCVYGDMNLDELLSKLYGEKP